MSIDPTAPLTPEGPDETVVSTPAGASGEPPRSGRSRRTVALIVLAAVLVGGAIGAGVVLLSSGDDGSEVGVATSTTVASTTTTIPVATKPLETTPRAPATPTTTAAAAASATTTSTTTTTAVPAPVITQFVVAPPLIVCPAPGASVGVTIVWATEHAATVTLTSPEATKTLSNTSGSTAAAVTCLPGSARVYTLTATGPGGTTSRTAVVQMVPA